MKISGSKDDLCGSKIEQKGSESHNLTEPPKDYIHVRARRGQATDSHSLAERVIPFHSPPQFPRFTVISWFKLIVFRLGEKRSVKEWKSFKIWSPDVTRFVYNNQDYDFFIFGVKMIDFDTVYQVIGKALVLDEIINYIQSLQHQVEVISFLYMITQK